MSKLDFSTERSVFTPHERTTPKFLTVKRNSEVRFFHIRKYRSWYDEILMFTQLAIDNHGGLTIAAKQVGPTVIYTLARCSKRDNFCRKTGRNIAQRRLNSDKAHKRTFLGTMDSFEKYVYEHYKG